MCTWFKNAWYYLNFYWKVYFTSHFKNPPVNPVSKDGYTLVFQDEFDKPVYVEGYPNNGLDWNKWKLCPPNNTLDGMRDYKNDHPNEYITWRPDQISVTAEKGLVMVTDINPDSGQTIVSKWGPNAVEAFVKSGEIYSYPTFNTKYGFFEVRMIPNPEGGQYWCCPWMYGCTGDYSEIDFGEFECEDSKHFTNTIYGKDMKGLDHRKWYTKIDLSTGFHTFAVEWEADHITFYLDNITLWTYTGSEMPTAPMSIYIDMAIMGGFNPTGIPVDTLKAMFPRQMTVDYVRAYKKN